MQFCLVAVIIKEQQNHTWAGPVSAPQVLTDVEELRSRPAADSSAAATGTSAAADDLQPTSPRGRARGGSSAGGASRDGSSREAQLAALNNLLKAENNRLRDRALKDGHRLRQLASSLAGSLKCLEIRWCLADPGRRARYCSN